jgi:uncharacterized membrane protein YeaQ/YmgE (transglycosylase-associated protein family)
MFMNLMIWLALGGLIGWLASLVMKTDGPQGVIVDVVAGTIGTLLAIWFLSPLVDFGTVNEARFSVPSLGASLIGAIALLVIVNLSRRWGMR